jgi:hypothetical protein
LGSGQALITMIDWHGHEGTGGSRKWGVVRL